MMYIMNLPVWWQLGKFTLYCDTFCLKAGGKTASDRVSDDRHDPFCPWRAAFLCQIPRWWQWDPDNLVSAVLSETLLLSCCRRMQHSLRWLCRKWWSPMGWDESFFFFSLCRKCRCWWALTLEEVVGHMHPQESCAVQSPQQQFEK